MWDDEKVIKQVKYGWLWWSLKLKRKQALKWLKWNQFLKINKDIKQWTNDIGPVSLFLNENESEIYTKFN